MQIFLVGLLLLVRPDSKHHFKQRAEHWQRQVRHVHVRFGRDHLFRQDAIRRGGAEFIGQHAT